MVREAGGYATDVDAGSPLETGNIVSGTRICIRSYGP